MPETPRTVASVAKYRKVAYIAAAIGTAVAVGFCALTGMGPTEYDSQAVLSYAVDPSSRLSALPAEKVAARALDDQHLNTILDGFGLYPEMRQGSLQMLALRRLRSNISVTQSRVPQQNQVTVHLEFRDPNPMRGPAVTNALADVLATYILPQSEVSQPSFAEQGSLASTGSVVEGTVPLANDSVRLNPGSTANVPPAAAIPKPASSSLSGLTKEQLRSKINWVDGQLADLATEQSTLHAASLTVQGHISQLQASGHDEDAAPREPSRAVVDPNAATRVQLTQQLAAEQQKLTSLRERYTDAYPDVQATQTVVMTLQAKLAALPPIPRQPAAPRPAADLYQNNMDQLTVEESKLGEKLRDIERQIAGLEHYRERVRSAMQSAPDSASAVAQPSSQPFAAPATPPRSAPPSVQGPGGVGTAPLSTAANLGDSVNRPFRIIEAAGNSVPVHRVSPTTFASVAGGWLVLMLLCLIPLRWMQSAVVRSEGDVRAAIPRQVAYLGSIRRIVS